MKPREFFDLINAAGAKWLKDRAPRMGAALAFYTVFSMAPLLVIAVGVAGLLFGKEAARGGISEQLGHLMGPEGGKTVEAVLASASAPSSGILATVVGVVILLVGAMGVFGELQDSLNTIWGVQAKPGRAWRGIIRERLLSFVMILSVVFLLLVSLVVSAVLSALGGMMKEWETTWFQHLLNTGISFAVITGLFATIFRLLPDVQIAWRDVWLGAIVTAALFALGKFLIGWYLGHSSIGSAYGAAGSLAVLLVWLYYSAQIFLFGAELTQVYATTHGSSIVPRRSAERLVHAE
jgi:membrane protein